MGQFMDTGDITSLLAMLTPLKLPMLPLLVLFAGTGGRPAAGCDVAAPLSIDGR